MKREQKFLEILSSGYLFIFLFASTVVFMTTNETSGLIAFSKAINVAITNNFFAILSIAGMFICILPLVLRVSVIQKRSLYLLASYPLPIYTIPIGWYAARTRGSGIGILIYLLFEFSFFIISRSVWRTERKSDVTLSDTHSHADTSNKPHYNWITRFPHYRRSAPHSSLDRS